MKRVMGTRCNFHSFMASWLNYCAYFWRISPYSSRNCCYCDCDKAHYGLSSHTSGLTDCGSMRPQFRKKPQNNLKGIQLKLLDPLLCLMAEREGFEPSRRVLVPPTRFPVERLRPTQPSLRVCCSPVLYQNFNPQQSQPARATSSSERGS